MNLEEELVENFADSFTTPLYILPPSHQVYTAPISQYHHYMAMWDLDTISKQGKCYIVLVGQNSTIYFS
jgi:hypothetical protein